MGLQHSLPRDEASQYALVESWLTETETRIALLGCQGTPVDSPECQEVVQYYAQLLRARRMWRRRKGEHCDSVCAGCWLPPGPLSRGWLLG
jgi:hypothetical protein